MSDPDLEYSDWITYPYRTQARLDRLRLFIAEIYNLIAPGNFSGGGNSQSYDYWSDQLVELGKKEERYSEQLGQKSNSPCIRGRISR